MSTPATVPTEGDRHEAPPVMPAPAPPPAPVERGAARAVVMGDLHDLESTINERLARVEAARGAAPAPAPAPLDDLDDDDDDAGGIGPRDFALVAIALLGALGFALWEKTRHP